MTVELKTREAWTQSQMATLEQNHPKALLLDFSHLHAILEDTLPRGYSVEPHEHRSLEILTVVLDGTLAHKDSLGNGSLIHPGEINRITTGTGIHYSEFNPSDLEPVRYLQFWIQPSQPDLAPSGEQMAFPREEWQGHWVCLAAGSEDVSGQPAPHAEPLATTSGEILSSTEQPSCPSSQWASRPLSLHQDTSLHATRLSYGEEKAYPLQPDRVCWVQVGRGVAQLNGKLMETGDGAAVYQEEEVLLEGVSNEAEIYLLDLPLQPAR